MSFDVIPAVDLVSGQVVRVERGDLSRKTVYGDDPVAVAAGFAEDGAGRLHVVDLEGAVAGEPFHLETVTAIVEQVRIPVQVAGGIRTLELAQRYLDAGADRVVIGTRAVTDDDFLAAAVEALGSRLVVAPDVRDREVRVSGWTQGTGEDVADCVRRLAGAGVVRLLCTDVGRDGMLSGPNVELYAEVTEAGGLPVIASGGVKTTEDVVALAAVDGVEGVVVGKALYEGTVSLSDALAAVR